MRPFRESDLDAYTAVLQTAQVRAALHLPDDVGRERAWAGMAAWLGQWQLRGTGQWALDERATGAFVGRAGSHWPEQADWPGIEIGWTLHPDHWGNGYATEAARAAVAFGFEQAGLKEILSFTSVGNLRSQRVMQRIGMVRDPAGDFEHPAVPSGHPIRPHVLYRIRRESGSP